MLRPVLSLALLACGVACGPMPGADAGVKWEAAFDTSETGWLLNAWGRGDDDLWVVGGRAGASTVLHADAQGWAPVSVPAASLLNWAYGFGASELFIVGDLGTVLHFDGSAWETQPTPTRQPLWGVWGASRDDVWAVGGDGVEPHATLLHYDGAAWAEVALPTLQKQRVGQLLKVWGTGADDVWVVGQRGVVLHRTGGAWREELVGASDDLVSVWGADGVVVAVGGRSNALVARWDGATWTTRELAPTPGLNGVWLRTGAVAHVVGVDGTLARLDVATLTLTPESSAVRDDFHSVFGTGTRLVAVGGNLQNANPLTYRGVAQTRLLGSSE